MSMKLFFLLGAADPEMGRIEELLKACEKPFAYAQKDGKRCHSGNAYEADLVDVPDDHMLVYVECECPAYQDNFILCDHHKPGDPGFEAQPKDFFIASSIGQVLHLLNREPCDTDRLVAAADHCLSAAYQGQCPGVDPKDLRKFRLESRAAFQRRSIDEIEKDINSSIEIVRDLIYAKNRGCDYHAPHADAACHDCANWMDCFEEWVDLSTQPTGSIPEAPEVAAILGVMVQTRTGAKWNLLGYGDPKHFKRWLVQQQFLGRKTYGDPMRGIVGAIQNNP